MLEIKIGHKKIGSDHPVYIIAEIGLNHQGDIKLAKKLIDASVKAKADAVKFQKRSLKKVYTSGALDHPENQEHGTNYIVNHLKKTELTEDDMRKLCQYAKSKG